MSTERIIAPNGALLAERAAAWIGNVMVVGGVAGGYLEEAKGVREAKA